MAHTVMRFQSIEFDNNWSRAGTVVYMATNEAQVTVVAAGTRGVQETYRFTVPKGEVAVVAWDTRLFYVPARCVQQAAADKTECARG